MTFNSTAFRAIAQGCLASLFLLSSAPASIAQTENIGTTETVESSLDTIESVEAAAIEKTTEWSDAKSIEDSFKQGCIGEDPNLPTEGSTKENFCECAFEAYASSYSPYQFTQINTLASQIGEDGILLINLMMRNQMNACAEETGFELK